MSSWQPIETAPRNYAPILLKQDETVGEGWHASHLKTWEFANPSHVMRRHPTHWQPLPASAQETPLECSECRNQRAVLVEGVPMPCPHCCCPDCGIAPGGKHSPVCNAPNR
jgi:hypothetical protein